MTSSIPAIFTAIPCIESNIFQIFFVSSFKNTAAKSRCDLLVT